MPDRIPHNAGKPGGNQYKYGIERHGSDGTKMNDSHIERHGDNVHIEVPVGPIVEPGIGAHGRREGVVEPSVYPIFGIGTQRHDRGIERHAQRLLGNRSEDVDLVGRGLELGGFGGTIERRAG